jgi:glycosyltransferase involved in cell wall biosynthesis
MPPKPLLSVVVPAYNEEHTIGDVISRLQAVMKKIEFDYEIIVVNDRSRDRTAEISRSYNVKVYSLKQHKGKGYALRAGFSHVRGDIVVTIDSDGSHRPEELPSLLLPILQNQADLVIGSRFLRKEPVGGKKFNFAGNRLFNLLVQFLTGAQVSDSQSGYRTMKRVVLENLRLKSAEYEIESEMLVRIAKKGFRVKEVPVSFEQRTYGRSTLDPIVDGFKILMSIFTSYLKD